MRPADNKTIAQWAVKYKSYSIATLCRLLGISVKCYNYKAKRIDVNESIAIWLLQLTTINKRWGFGLCFLYLRNVKGFLWNHKRVYRIYKELELNLQIKPRRRIKRAEPDPLSPPSSPNHTWSMDFMSDKLFNGRSFRSFNVLDDFNREALSIEIDISIPSARVIRALDQLIEQRGKPHALRCDNGPEYTSNELASPNKMYMLKGLTAR